MKCVILAAGEGKRMRPLTAKTPKPLIVVGGKTLLQRTLELVPKDCEKIIIVIGYLGEQIIEFCNMKFPDLPIEYVAQNEQLGTGHALFLCKEYLKDDRFLVLVADDLLDKKNIEEMFRYPRALLVNEHPEPSRFGVVEANDEGIVTAILEKPENPKSNLVSTAVMLLDNNIFKYNARLSPVGEYYLTDSFNEMLKDFPVHMVHSDFWFPVGRVQDIAPAEEALKERGEI